MAESPANTHTRASSRRIKKKVYPDSIYSEVPDTPEVTPTKPPATPVSTPTITAQPTPPVAPNSQNKKKKPVKPSKDKDKDSSSSSDEERWLEKIKDPKMMTARQRAMYDRENGEKDFVVPPEALVSLPTGYPKEKVMTAEAIERAQVKSAKRKQLADEKREKDKRKTMDRLLKKQESSKLNRVNKAKQLKPGVPIITYRSTVKDGSLLILPPDFELKLGGEIREEKKLILCGVCRKNPKCYNSKENVPLCSLRCFRENEKEIGKGK